MTSATLVKSPQEKTTPTHPAMPSPAYSRAGHLPTPVQAGMERLHTRDGSSFGASAAYGGEKTEERGKIESYHALSDDEGYDSDE